PVHDGAVLIRGQRIDRVGTILPLTRRTDLPPQYGTRHRAAIGLGDASDAYILVVSEERGEVSLVHRGHVTLVENRETLLEVLRHHFGYDLQARRTRTLRRELFRQTAGFLLTTGAVAAYWAVFYGRQVSLTTVTSVIDFQNVPEGLEMTWASYKHLDIQIHGQRPLIEDLKLHPERVSVSVSLKGFKPGSGQTITIDPEDIELPVGLEVYRLTPSSITVNLERHVSRAVKIEPQFARPLPEGSTVAVEPDTLVVVGPESAVKSLRSVPTIPILPPRLTAEHPEAVLSVPLGAPADSTLPAEGQPDKVRVRIRLTPASPPEPTPPQPTPEPENTPSEP
ncbi:MAG TPA: diadenylate cyclase, partial [Isosphaeraceae bacterium]|nr:diadenylate cyclase [Isosphaeraceae bacterium]